MISGVAEVFVASVERLCCLIFVCDTWTRFMIYKKYSYIKYSYIKYIYIKYKLTLFIFAEAQSAVAYSHFYFYRSTVHFVESFN